MNDIRKSLKTPRSVAYSLQNGCCYYCNQPMCDNDPEKFATKHNITPGQAKLLRCTGEHLIPHQDGGTSKSDNIVAACLFCNSHRHKYNRQEIHPEAYKKLARNRLSTGHWHGLNLVSK